MRGECKVTVLYDIYDNGRLIGPNKTLRQIRQLFGDGVAVMLQASGAVTYEKYRIVKKV